MGSISPISNLIGEPGNSASLGPQIGKSEFLELLMAQVNTCGVRSPPSSRSPRESATTSTCWIPSSSSPVPFTSWTGVISTLLVCMSFNRFFENPLEPMDNAEFVSQLTEFSSLEQLMLIREATELIAFLGNGLQGVQEVEPLLEIEGGSGSGGTVGSPEAESAFLLGGSEGAPQDQ